jgi:hypothetical protein
METNTTTKRNFILQQGFQDASAAGCSLQYSALQFQPRVVLTWIVVAIVLQSPPVFVALAAVLWFSALVPNLNPFEAIYNWTMGRRHGGFRLDPAPAPRRAAQFMAGAFALACALFIYFDLAIAAYIVEVVFVAAVLALILGGFCLGSFVYHLLRGDSKFARNTLPWAR